MGLFSHSSSNPPGALELFNPPLGIDPSFCVGQTTVLSIKTSTWDVDYDITDTQGRVVVRCEGKALSKKKEVKHPQTGQLLYSLEGKFLSKSEFGVGPMGQEVFEVKPKKGVGKTEVHISFINASTSAPVELVLTATTHHGKAAEIYLGDRAVAWIAKETKVMSSTPYLVTVAPGVDLALMAAICVCYDKLLASKRATNNASLGALTALTA